jgi:hypothetical protein
VSLQAKLCQCCDQFHLLKCHQTCSPNQHKFAFAEVLQVKEVHLLLSNISPIFQRLFSWYNRVSINIFVFFQNKIVESKYKWLFSETYVEKFHKYFWFWSKQIVPSSLFSFQLMTSIKKICRNFYVIFLRNVSSSNVCTALGKTQNTENLKP